ncbi:DUF4873 domain-containing protein [Nocardia thailandica]
MSVLVLGPDRDRRLLAAALGRPVTGAPAPVELTFDEDADAWRARFADGRVVRSPLVVLGTGLPCPPDGPALPVYGRGARELSAVLAPRPRTLLGLAVHGFPNLFLLDGPDSGAARPLSPRSRRARASCLAGLIRHTERVAATRIEVRASSQHESSRRLAAYVVSGTKPPAVRDAAHRRAVRRCTARHFDLTVAADREPAWDYAGPAVLELPGEDIAVTTTLAGHPDPIDGRYHWYGRVRAVDPAAPLPTRLRVSAALRTDGVAVAVTLAERDPWGGLRVTGTGPPPYGRSRAQCSDSASR